MNAIQLDSRGRTTPYSVGSTLGRPEKKFAPRLVKFCTNTMLSVHCELQIPCMYFSCFVQRTREIESNFCFDSGKVQELIN